LNGKICVLRAVAANSRFLVSPGNDKLENLFLNLAQHEAKALKLFVAELLSQTRQGITAFPPGIEATLQGPDAGDAVTA
jgi:hypothetical protein